MLRNVGQQWTTDLPDEKLHFFGYFCRISFLFEIYILLIYFYVEYLFNFFIKYLFNLVNVSTVFIPIK